MTLAKQNKNIGANKEKTLPWFIIFEVKGEEIQATYEWPQPNDQRPDVNVSD
jgi:hypothetical protein